MMSKSLFFGMKVKVLFLYYLKDFINSREKIENFNQYICFAVYSNKMVKSNLLFA